MRPVSLPPTAIIALQRAPLDIPRLAGGLLVAGLFLDQAFKEISGNFALK